jgi:hypothetical protein
MRVIRIQNSQVLLSRLPVPCVAHRGLGPNRTYIRRGAGFHCGASPAGVLLPVSSRLA